MLWFISVIGDLCDQNATPGFKQTNKLSQQHCIMSVLRALSIFLIGLVRFMTRIHSF